jgi:hypothetical protein
MEVLELVRMEHFERKDAILIVSNYVDKASDDRTEMSYFQTLLGIKEKISNLHHELSKRE